MILTAHRRIWSFYLLTIGAIVLSVTLASGGRVPGGEPWLFLGIHAALFGSALGVVRLFAGGWPAALATGVFSLIALPIVFSSLGLVLPAIQPEPWEWHWIALDAALFGSDPSVWLQRVLWPPFTELMQLCYASFYLVPIAAIVAAGVWSGRRAFERAQILVVFGFLLSYLGYALWPTLPPYRFLWHDRAIEGVWLAQRIHTLLDSAEINRWDCFPSGHTMLSVLSLTLFWRYARPVFWFMLPVVAVLVFSTVALRYHYAVDVLAGLIGVPIASWLGSRVIASASSDADAITRNACRAPTAISQQP